MNEKEQEKEKPMAVMVERFDLEKREEGQKERYQVKRMEIGTEEALLPRHVCRE